MSRASRLSGFTTAISGDTDLNVGIVTAKQLNVNQSFTFTDINVTGVATASNLNVTGVSTLGNVVVGGATTDLVVNGNARVTGILTVGTSSLTLNGDSSTISGITTINSVSLPSTGGLTNRNMVINGAMQVAQRGTSSTTLGYSTVDRFQVGLGGGTGVLTLSQSTDSPQGFANSFKVDVDTADTLTGDEEFYLDTRLESQDLQHLKYGTSSAESVTLSFWVKSFQTGQFSVLLYQADSNRDIFKEYTVNTSATWEYKTLTFPGDASGSFDDDNGLGLLVRFYLGAGPNREGAVPTDWNAHETADRVSSNQVQVISSTSNYWQITGVQLEVGNQATSFEHRSYGDELQKCRRYFQHFTCGGSGTATGANQTQSAMCSVNYSPEMRDVPTITFGTITSSTNCTGSISAFVPRKTGCSPGAQATASGRQFWGVGLSTASSEI